jgi:hypothetical protein
MSEPAAQVWSEDISTVLLQRRGSGFHRPHWTRHLSGNGHLTLCGLRAAKLHRAEDGDARVDLQHIRTCQRCQKIVKRRKMAPYSL